MTRVGYMCESLMSTRHDMKSEIMMVPAEAGSAPVDLDVKCLLYIARAAWQDPACQWGRNRMSHAETGKPKCEVVAQVPTDARNTSHLRLTHDGLLL